MASQAQRGLVKLTALGILEIFEIIDVELDNCPPGYVLAEDPAASMEPSCFCGSHYNATTKIKYYDAIIYCNKVQFSAKLAIGNWAGYCSQNNTKFLYSTMPA